MYQIRCGNYLLWDMRDEDLRAGNCKLEMEVNTAGSLQFNIYPGHPHYTVLKKLSSVVEVLKEGRVIFKSRVMDDRQTFYNAKNVVCEGKLAFLNDSVFRPFEFTGSPEELFTMLVENHNEQVLPHQRFKVGRVTVTDPNDYIVRSSIEYLKTWQVLKTRLFESSLGGYLSLRYEDDGDYLDYLADFDKISAQPIRFGENLLDLNREISAEETYTAMIPLGAKDEESGKRIDITSVNGGCDYIINEEKAEEYGVIYAPADASIWEDVTIPANLLKKAREYLDNTGIKLRETMELSAVDLNLTDKEIESFNIGEYINVISIPHGVNERYLLRKLSIDLNNIQNTKITLGESRLTLADFQMQAEKKTGDVDSRVQVIEESYLDSDKAERIVSQKAEEAAGNKVTEVMDGFISESFLPGNHIELTITENKQLKISAVIPEGISPEITEASNTEDEYILTVTDKNGSYHTPNLKGPRGEKGTDGQDGAPGAQGPKGEPGPDGFTPTITEDSGNSDEITVSTLQTLPGLF